MDRSLFRANARLEKARLAVVLGDVEAGRREMQQSQHDAAGARDCWIAVGLDAQIRPQSSHPVIVAGRELALWRGETGPAKVWDDQCPHRGMRLSFGFVRDGTLRCLYHGWGYGEDGRCVSIPAHPELAPPKTICAGAHAVATKYGIIWSNLSAARAATVPEIPAVTDWRPVRSLYIHRSAAVVLAGIAAFDYGAPAEPATPAADVYVVTLGAQTQLLLALQPVEANKTGVHIASSGVDATADRLALVRQMHSLRDAIEAGTGPSR